MKTIFFDKYINCDNAYHGAKTSKLITYYLINIAKICNNTNAFSVSIEVYCYTPLNCTVHEIHTVLSSIKFVNYQLRTILLFKFNFLITEIVVLINSLFLKSKTIKNNKIYFIDLSTVSIVEFQGPS